jgi:hypothetical protein
MVTIRELAGALQHSMLHQTSTHFTGLDQGPIEALTGLGNAQFGGRAGIKDLLHTSVPASMAQPMCLSRDGTFRFPELGNVMADPRDWPALTGSLLMNLQAMGGPF